MSATGHSATSVGSTPALDFVVLAASFGGISAIGEILSRLPKFFAAAVVVVQHRRPTDVVLRDLLGWRATLPVVEATPDTRPSAGTVYVTAPQRQLVLDGDGCFVVSDARGPCRADPLLRSAAAAYGARVLAVILTGRLDDGAAGAVAVKSAGGRVIAQDRATSAAFSMPAATIVTGCVDFVLPLPAIPAAIVTLTMVPAAEALFRVARAPWAAAAG